MAGGAVSVGASAPMRGLGCSFSWSRGRLHSLRFGGRDNGRPFSLPWPSRGRSTTRKRRTVVVRVSSGGQVKRLGKMQSSGNRKMAWLGDVFSKAKTEGDKTRAEESAIKLFEEIRMAELKRTSEEEELIRIAKLQAERDYMQITMWNKSILKLRGRLKGTQWDPEPSHAIPFSDFWKLLETGQVKFLEYAELGRDVAVVIPYEKEDDSIVMQPIDSGLLAKDPKKRSFVYRRHKVGQMPPDAWGDIWPRLHQQLEHVEIKQPNTLPALFYPTMETVVVWGLRLLLAFLLYKWIDKKLYPIYKLPNPENRPVLRRPKLSASGNSELGSLGQSRARFISAEESTGVTFDDFAGQEYVKRELEEVVRILKESKEFEEFGVYCPKGVMLYGPPGTGKTLLARAIAGEAGVPFFSASGSEFVEMFVGVAAARVRDLFARARQFAPSIIFIDEIDAIGAKRGGPDIGGGGVEREQGLIQILTELDGFQSNFSQVLVVGATNRLDMLDPALLRKGRFDKTISIGLPSLEGRLAILRVHARNKGFNSEQEKNELLKYVAEEAHDFSGAELQNVLNEGAILAARKEKDIIERPEIVEALRRQEGTFSTGEEESMDSAGEARLRVAYREAAIAMLECYFPNPSHPFTKTNVREIDTYPNMEYAESRHRVFARKPDMIKEIIRACARSALAEAGVLADFLILRTGMTALGKIYYRTQQDLMAHLGPKVVSLREEYMRYAVQKCSSILKEYRSALETLADLLLEKEVVQADEIWDIFSKAPRFSQPEVKPIDEYAALIYVGRWGIHGASLPGRATFRPGNVGFVTYGAPRPLQLQVIKSETWDLIEALKQRGLERFSERHEEEEEEVTGTVISPSRQFL